MVYLDVYLGLGSLFLPPTKRGLSPVPRLSPVDLAYPFLWEIFTDSLPAGEVVEMPRSPRIPCCKLLGTGERVCLFPTGVVMSTRPWWKTLSGL